MALALSGGGDSVALLRIAADWARRRGRRLLALTVDHGLHPESGAWTAFAGKAAEAAGAEWRALRWDGEKPASGLPAAARRARHALIAEAARDGGARVVLMAHTRDDAAEGELMRAEGVTLGRLREWGPSPVWPEGRGLMLLRPMLGVDRADLRDWLASRGEHWIDDPANTDLRHPRVRARQALAETDAKGRGITAEREVGSLEARGVYLAEDAVQVSREVAPWVLAAALVAVGGGDRPPRGERLARLSARLRTGDDFVADLAGSRVEVCGGSVQVSRESGALARRAARPVPLRDGVETVWDGRWAVAAPGLGWSVTAARGLGASLSEADRGLLRALPAGQRPGRPVLIRDDGGAPILAGTRGQARALVGERLALALDTTTHERDLDGSTHGARPCQDLSPEPKTSPNGAPRQGTRRE